MAECLGMRLEVGRQIGVGRYRPSLRCPGGVSAGEYSVGATALGDAVVVVVKSATDCRDLGLSQMKAGWSRREVARRQNPGMGVVSSCVEGSAAGDRVTYLCGRGVVVAVVGAVAVVVVGRMSSVVEEAEAPPLSRLRVFSLALVCLTLGIAWR
jgi:hypothetical protein